MTPGQHDAVQQLQDVAIASGGMLTVEKASDGDDGIVRVDVTLGCAHLARVANGLPLRAREPFLIAIPPDFPFAKPDVWSQHDRFAGFPHVQWKRHLCLYQATGDWDVSDAMYGFMERLEQWLRRAALDQLDPIGAPLHPPVTYPKRAITLIPRKDTPTVTDSPWFGFVALNPMSPSRIDVGDWIPFGGEERPYVGAAILLPSPLPFEFPTQMGDLLQELDRQGISRSLVSSVLAFAARRNQEGSPLHVLIGAPMRGIRGEGNLRQHLTAWVLEAKLADSLRKTIPRDNDTDELLSLRQELANAVWDLAMFFPIAWCSVREDRPEIVTRRDFETPMAWFRGRTVSIWGCGALGSPIAEFLTRAGAKKLILRDQGDVAPGLLVRQFFDDRDIGRSKVEALAERLLRIRPDVEVSSHDDNILHVLDGDWCDGADVIIDTTGAESLLAKLELRRKDVKSAPPIISVAVSARATYGMAVVSLSNFSGGPIDIIRKTKLRLLSESGTLEIADAFWPSQASIFQPEPGCSEPTFIGSAADMSALAGTLLTYAAQSLASNGGATAHVITRNAGHRQPAQWKYTFDSDYVFTDMHAGYDIRIEPSAWSQIDAWITRNNRAGDRHTETGGLLFGERDDAIRTIWVGEVLGPPPDSIASRAEFRCGTRGTQEASDEKKHRSRGSLVYVGMWHTHPDELPLPSTTDLKGMAELTSATGQNPTKLLLLILTKTQAHTAAGAFVLRRSEFTNDRIPEQRARIYLVQWKRPKRRIGLALSGGGSRAIAFHLGCLRALHDRGILEQVRVLSCVSGGSVIGALWAYRDKTFTEFERDVVQLLRRGLLRSMITRALKPTQKILPSAALLATMGTDFVNLAQHVVRRQKALSSPLRRTRTRTMTLRDVLADVIGNSKITDVQRPEVDVVINACELRSGSAFRFGSKETHCWRYGFVVPNDVLVADAVAASAAYPALLPAVEQRFCFRKGAHKTTQRVLLTDGGVFDNLGVTPLEPGRSAAVTTTYDVDYIIACHAGQGIFGDDADPAWWPTRMMRSLEAIFRKVQDSSAKRLHQYSYTGELNGFLLPYLGQQDAALPYRPPDLVPREAVIDYPTDFSAMSDEMIERLSRRGEQLTRMLVDRYCPEL